jgi:WD40 repeat protein
VCFSPDGKRLASGGLTVKVWDTERGQELHVLDGHSQPVNSVCFSPDGTRLATASDDQTVKVWDAKRGQEILTLKGHTAPVLSVCFSPAGTRLATGSANGMVKLWDAEHGQELVTVRWVQGGHNIREWSVCFSPDGKRLAYCEQDCADYFTEMRVWDVERRREILTLGDYNCVCFSPDGKHLAIGNMFRHRGTSPPGVMVLDLAEAESRARAAGER